MTVWRLIYLTMWVVSKNTVLVTKSWKRVLIMQQFVPINLWLEKHLTLSVFMFVLTLWEYHICKNITKITIHIRLRAVAKQSRAECGATEIQNLSLWADWCPPPFTFRGFVPWPPDQGFSPGTLLEPLPPDLHYKRALHTRLDLEFRHLWDPTFTTVWEISKDMIADSGTTQKYWNIERWLFLTFLKLQF